MPKKKEENGMAELPLGFAMSLAQHADAMQCFGTLGDDRKQQVVSYIQSSATGPEAKHRIQVAVDGLSRNSIDFLG